MTWLFNEYVGGTSRHEIPMLRKVVPSFSSKGAKEASCRKVKGVSHLTVSLFDHSRFTSPLPHQPVAGVLARVKFNHSPTVFFAFAHHCWVLSLKGPFLKTSAVHPHLRCGFRTAMILKKEKMSCVVFCSVLFCFVLFCARQAPSYAETGCPLTIPSL